MEPIKDIKIAPTDSLDERYIDSRITEVSLLSQIQYLFIDLIGKPENEDPNSNYAVSTLADYLQQLYDSWQTFNNKPGLNSGGNGEVFCRLVGSGIFEDMPELMDVTSNINPEIEIVHRPASNKDRGVIKLTVLVGNSKAEQRSCQFKINASLTEINERIRQVNNEVDQKKLEIGKSQTTT